MDIMRTETPKPAAPDSLERKAALFLERAETRMIVHLRKEGNCAPFPFEHCPSCGGDDLRQELAKLYSGAPVAVMPHFDPKNPPRGPIPKPEPLRD